MKFASRDFSSSNDDSDIVKSWYFSSFSHFEQPDYWLRWLAWNFNVLTGKLSTLSSLIKLATYHEWRDCSSTSSRVVIVGIFSSPICNLPLINFRLPLRSLSLSPPYFHIIIVIVVVPMIIKFSTNLNIFTLNDCTFHITWWCERKALNCRKISCSLLLALRQPLTRASSKVNFRWQILFRRLSCHVSSLVIFYSAFSLMSNRLNTFQREQEKSFPCSVIQFKWELWTPKILDENVWISFSVWAFWTLPSSAWLITKKVVHTSETRECSLWENGKFFWGKKLFTNKIESEKCSDKQVN